MRSRSGFAPIIIAIVIALAVVLIGGGYVVYKNSQQQPTGNNSQQTQNQSSTTSNPLLTTNNSASSTVDTSGWKTYRNEKYGFEMKYPPYLFTDPEEASSSGLTLYHNKPKSYGTDLDFLGVSVDFNPYNLSVEKYYTDPSPRNSLADFYLAGIFTTSTVYGVTAYTFVDKNPTHEKEIIIPHGEIFLIINDFGLTFQKDELFNQIISTFRFTKSPSSIWKMYRNDKFGLTIKFVDENVDTPDVFVDSTSSVYFSGVAGGGFEVHFYHDPGLFHSITYDGYDDASSDLTYSSKNRQWIATRPAGNLFCGSAEDTSGESCPSETIRFCPSEGKTDQGALYYEVSDGHHAGDNFSVFLRNQAMVAITGDNFLTAAQILFDHPEESLKATCRVIK